MKTLCLVPGAENEVPFRPIRYPDGQVDIVLQARIDDDLTISSRMNGFADLELILAATSAARTAGADSVSLRVPYLLGARSDRVFQPGGSNYLRDVIAPTLNCQHYHQVWMLDPHSNTSTQEIRRSKEIPIRPFMRFCFERANLNNPYLICPDKGAQRRVRDAALLVNAPDKWIVTCQKVREPATGKITQTVVPLDDFRLWDAVVIDDICDGGRTFIEIAKVIRQRNVGQMFLFVTHGIFSAGFGELEQWFDGIICTNSVRDVDHPMVSQFKVF